MTLDDVLRIVTIVAPSGITGFLAGGAGKLWQQRHDRKQKLDDTRRERLATWRAELRDQENRKDRITAIASWPEIRVFMSDKLRREAEKPATDIRVTLAFIGGRPTLASTRTHPWDDVLDQLAELERTWKLI